MSYEREVGFVFFLKLSFFLIFFSDCLSCFSGDLLKVDVAYHFYFISSPEHEVLMVSYCGQSMSVVRHAASTIALKAYSSYTPGPIHLILGRKHQGDL